MELLPMSAEQIELLIVKSKYTGDNEAEFLLHMVIYLHYCDAQIDNENIKTIVTIIIVSILLDKPLLTQRKKIKSLYKHFGTEANKSKANVAKMKLDLETVEQRGEGYLHLKSALKDQISAEELALDSYAEEQSRINNNCPICMVSDAHELSVGCNECDGTGKIAVTMADARAYFNKLDLPYTPGKFASEYWSKIMLVVRKLQI